MKIAFKPIPPINNIYLQQITNDFDIIDRLDGTNLNHFNYYQIYDVQSYTDNSRYQLNLYKVQYQRKVNVNNNFYMQPAKHIQVIAIDFNFDFDFDFSLLSEKYVDLWRNNLNLDYIRPYGFSADNRNNISFQVFNSLITDLFAKIFNLISSKNILCFKYNNKLILAYLIIDEKTNNHLNDILEYLLNIVYEFVNIAHTYLDFNLPPEIGLNKIEMSDWYNKKKKRTWFKRNKK